MTELIFFDGSSQKQLICVVRVRRGIVEATVRPIRNVLTDLRLNIDIPPTKSQRAEYLAVLEALNSINSYEHHTITGDCENVILQLVGINRVSDPILKKFHHKAHQLINTRGLDVSFEHIARKENLAGIELDGR